MRPLEKALLLAGESSILYFPSLNKNTIKITIYISLSVVSKFPYKN